MVSKRAHDQNNKKLQMISLVIYNYVLKMSKDNSIDLNNLPDLNSLEINLIPFFEYISYNNIELLNFENINPSDIDVSKNEDIERFVLSHVYYITQK
jgi:hypothetical protein